MKTKVLITGAGGVSVGHQIILSLQEYPDLYELGATDITPYSYGLFEVENKYVVPRGDDPAYIETMLSITEKESYDVLIPGSEVELFPLAANSDAFRKAGAIILINSYEVIGTYLNKWSMFNALRSKGFKTPNSAPLAEWESFLRVSDFPVLIKPMLQSGGSRNVDILFTMDELNRTLEVMDTSGFIIQEYIGSGEEEYTVGVLISPDGTIIDSIVLQRILQGISLKKSLRRQEREYAISSGITQGQIIRHPEIQQYCEDLALAIGARGPLNIQCRKTDDGIYTFEVHPRFSGSAYIRTSVGLNEAHLLIGSFLFGKTIGRIPYKSGIVSIRGIHHINVEIESIKQLMTRKW